MIRLAICRGQFMKRFVEGADRGQTTLLPEYLDEWVEESNSVRVVDSFVDALDLADLGFEGIEPAATGRPAYHPSVLLKLFGAKGFVSVAIARRWIGRARLPADGRTNHRMVRNYRRRLRRRQKCGAHQVCLAVALRFEFFQTTGRA
jgi:hypothetical protein